MTVRDRQRAPRLVLNAFDLDFFDGGQRRRTALGTGWGVRFEDVSPVRGFRWNKGDRSFPGWYYPATTGSHVGYESWLERDRLMLLDFDPDVVGIASQPLWPLWPHWRDGGKKRRHAPDYCVRLADGRVRVADVRAVDQIDERTAEAFAATGRGMSVPPKRLYRSRCSSAALDGGSVEHVEAGHGLAGVRQLWQSSHALLVIPIVLIVVITAVDQLVPADIHLGPLLVIAPAITASFAGPRLTGLIGFLAVAAQAYIGWHFGVLLSRNVLVQILALAVLSAMIVFFCVVRERYRRQLAQVRSVAEAAQHVLLWPLPERIGALRIACLYLAAEDEAQIGGDLYAATRIIGGVRIMIGDVRGKGLSAIGEAALLLGAFREAAHRHTSLPDLAAALEQSVARYLADFEPAEETGERFATALLLELPDDDHITRIISCGHPPPMVLSPGSALTVPSLHPAPPLGIGEMGPEGYTIDVLSFEPGDTLLLYTDGVIEARDADGDFYPFETRAAQWGDAGPESLLHHIQRDLLAHTRGRLDDDAALVALRREPDIHRHRHHGRVIHASGFGHSS